MQETDTQPEAQEMPESAPEETETQPEPSVEGDGGVGPDYKTQGNA